MYEDSRNAGGSTISKSQTEKDTQFFKVSHKAMTINLADLCHKYYKAKPNFMSIDLEGVGRQVLMSNDWKTDKCLPDLIYSENWQ